MNFDFRCFLIICLFFLNIKFIFFNDFEIFISKIKKNILIYIYIYILKNTLYYNIK